MSSERVRITDVSPRDGLQNEPGVIPTEEKAELVRLLCETGVDEVEVTSFVSPKWVPQLGDAGDLLATLAPWIITSKHLPILSALIPNEQGLNALRAKEAEAHSMYLAGKHADNKGPQAHRHLESGRFITKLSVFTAASETFSRKNTNASIAESVERFRPVVDGALQSGRPVRGYVSCAIACPFEGPISPERVVDVCDMLVKLGVSEIDLGDTIGAGTPETTTALLDVVRRQLGSSWWTRDSMTLHLHDTFGRAAECVKVALDMGVRSFDGSVAGLGGCPYASTPGKRAPGNISTQTLVRTIHEAGYTTGVDMDKLEEAGRFATKIVTVARLRAAQAQTETKP